MRHSQDSDVANQRAWAADYKARYGVPPIAGGEAAVAPGGPAAPAAAPPAPAPAPAPAAPAFAPAAAPAAPVAPAAYPQASQPQQPAPGQAQAAPQGFPQQSTAQQPPLAGDPIAQAQQQAAGTPPEWLNPLVSRMDELQRAVNPPVVDPLAVELGMVPAPVQAPQVPDPQQVTPWSVPQAPGFPPAAQQQPAPGQAQQPAQPGQQPASAQQPSDVELVRQMIAEEARQQALAVYGPIHQQQEAQRRRSEGAALLEDYPDLRDPSRAQALLARSRDWAGQLGAPNMAGEPGFVELVYHAANSIAAAQAQAAAAQAQAPQAQAQAAAPGQLQAVPGTVPAQAPVAYPGAPAAPVAPGVTLEMPGGTPPAPVNANDVAAQIVTAGHGGLTSFWGG